MLCGGTSQLVAPHDNKLCRDYVLEFREEVNVTKCLQHYISNFWKCIHGKTHMFSEHMLKMCVCVCARAPWWQPLDRSKAAMMNRHLAQGSALAQWAVNLPLPLSACRMLNKVIWIFVILMCLHVKIHWSLTVKENMRTVILPCWPMRLHQWGISTNPWQSKYKSWTVY